MAKKKRFYSGMLSNDTSKMANMPTEVKMIQYPEVGGYFIEGALNDGVSGIDNQMSQDMAKKNKHNKPNKI